MSDLIRKKSVHFNLLRETHAEFRVLAFRKKLSMQEIVEGLISRLANGNPALTKPRFSKNHIFADNVRVCVF